VECKKTPETPFNKKKGRTEGESKETEEIL